ncbi:MAG: MogA/MoaB family molybdenum cofactor biosynthesis protein [Oscillospiraceae bacterium]|nr:MogA/MoaB family molybdenum cofactor biosynthesis protein [Oscillospiraceae bacterium]
MKHFTAAVITVSDKGYRGERVDTSGPALCALLKEQGYEIAYTSMVPDEAEQIRAELLKCADEKKLSLVLTTGGTGFSTRDITPEATKAVLERETPGIPELMRAESMKITPRGCLSRSVAGIRGRTLIINLPGSEKAAKENILAVLEPMEHGLEMLDTEGSADCADSPAKAAAK